MESIIGNKTKKLRARLGISTDGVRRELLGFLKASSKTTFAIRAHAYDDREAASLTALGQDMVRFRLFLGGRGTQALPIIGACKLFLQSENIFHHFQKRTANGNTDRMRSEGPRTTKCEARALHAPSFRADGTRPR